MKVDTGKLILRLMIGFLLLFHGWQKITGSLDGIAGALEANGFPGFISYGVYLGEVVAPLLIIAGVFSRLAAIVVAFTIFVAVYLIHMGDIFALDRFGGWAIETQAFYFLSSIVLALLGSGKYSLMPQSRWN